MTTKPNESLVATQETIEKMVDERLSQDTRDFLYYPSEEEIKTALEGNLCRCTGYVPILEALKSLASVT